MGAWIETEICLQVRTTVRVALLVGAWIETNQPTKKLNVNNTGGEMAGKKFNIKDMFASKNNGKEPAKEEAAESKAVKSGKISKAQYTKGEKKEDKMKCGGSVKAHANGGLVSRGNGCASSGKTRTKVC